MNKLHESDIIDDVYDILFKNTEHKTIDFIATFPNAEVNREFAYILLNNDLVIKVERV